MTFVSELREAAQLIPFKRVEYPDAKAPALTLYKSRT
jgi:hypothetical protein